ncbi:MAG TPA: hypothetical protein VHY22_03665 [Chthoniobacteraceae bacterium]|jgi:hypothetical protein|nr:hypothetical protein [Chthoniobacteraceae bacterium]
MLVSIGTFNLCDGTREGGVGTTRLRFRVNRKIQVQELFRADQVETFDRGNRQTIAKFEITRTFPTQEEADVYVLEHEETIPSSGLVAFTAIQPNGQKVLRYLAGGKVESHELMEQIGVTTRHQYTIVGGEIQQTMPSD